MNSDFVLTTCPFCGTGCNFYLEVEDGELKGVVPCKTHPVSRGKLCVLGRSAHKFVQHPERLKNPLVKKNGRFFETDWNTALKEISERLKKIIEKYGPDSVGIISSAKCTNEENYLIMKFARAAVGTNNIDHCARLCHSSTVEGLRQAFGAGAMTNSITEIDQAECIFITGSNTTSQHPLVASWIISAKQKGARLIVADPRSIPISRYADIYLRIKPGTNIALINGLLHVIIKEGLIDRSFISERTQGFQEIEETVKRYDPDYVSSITGASKELIEKAAILYARSRSMLFYAMGITQHINGTDNVKAIANLSLATGNIGKPATGVNPLRGQNNVQGACDMGALPDVLTGYRRVDDEDAKRIFEKEWGVPVPEKKGLTLVEMMNEAEKGSLKAMIIFGENPAISDPDISHVKKALSSLELLVVVDIFLTETAELAHFVLPASSFAEKDGTFTNTDRRVQRVRKAIDPVGNSMPDWKIVCEIAERIGAKGFNYSSPKQIMDEIRRLTPSYAGITYERLESGETIQWPCPSEDHPGTPFLYKDGFPIGKARFFSVEHTQIKPSDKYPFILITGRCPFHFHTGSITRKIERLESEVNEGYVEISRRDAERLGIKEGDTVEVISETGKIEIKAYVSEGIEPGVIFIPMHFKESPANMLVSRKLDPFSKIPNFKACAVNVKRK